jgi:hypothetical protein
MNRALIFFSSCIIRCNLSTTTKLKKKTLGKTQDLVQSKLWIFLCNWFPINPTFQVLKFDNEDEDVDISLITPNIETKRKGLEVFL